MKDNTLFDVTYFLLLLRVLPIEKPLFQKNQITHDLYSYKQESKVQVRTTPKKILDPLLQNSHSLFHFSSADMCTNLLNFHTIELGFEV